MVTFSWRKPQKSVLPLSGEAKAELKATLQKEGLL